MSWFGRLNARRGKFPVKPLAFEAEGGSDEAVAKREPAARAHVARRPKGPSWLPAFKATASDQPKLSENSRFAEARLRLRTAYTPSQPVIDPNMFAGRTQVLATLIRAIEDERLHAIIYGERGIGKTSLMHAVTHAAREARYLVVYISCGAACRFDEVFRVVANEVPLIFHRDYGPNSPEAERGGTLADLLPATPVSVAQASDYLAKVVGTRVLVALDEFDRVESAELRLNIAEFVKNLSDRAVRAQLLIAGVAANLTELLAHVPSIQRSIFALPVPRMTDADVRELVEIGERRSDLQFEEAARRFIVAAANGLPYLASLLCHHAGLEAIESSRLDVTRADVAAAVAKALHEQEGRISRRSQQQIAKYIEDGSTTVLGGLSLLAQLSGGAFSVDELASTWPGPEGIVRTHALVDRLTIDGVLSKRDDDGFGPTYRFAEASIPIYLWLLAAQTRFRNEARPEVRVERDRGISAVL